MEIEAGYLGGYPGHPKPVEYGLLSATGEGLRFSEVKMVNMMERGVPLFTIPWDQIRSALYDPAAKVNRSAHGKTVAVTVAGGLALGAATAAAHHKRVSSRNCPLDVTLTDGVVAHFAASSGELQQLASEVAGIRGSAPIGSASVPAQAAAAMPADERLRRLAALHADGLVSDAEFAAKRGELLGDL